MSMTNEERAARVANALEAFAADTGLDITEDGPETVGGDFIAGILHWVAARGADPELAIKAAASGVSHFMAERFDVDETCADVDFQIDLTARNEQIGVEATYVTGGGAELHIDEDLYTSYRQTYGAAPTP